jgi:hypothetical protein
MTDGVAGREIVVFLGPSLAPEVARRILPACYLPPAACGDVVRCLRLKPKIIAMIDGVFESVPAVWHKEILLAIEEGIAVFGASSMGALRAAELAPFGMIGIGRIFEAYRDGLYTDDDEVAVLHSSTVGEYRPLSEPMVNIRATIEHAIGAGVITPELGELVIGSAKQTFYQERSLKGAVERARAAGATGEEVDGLLRFVENDGYVDQKRLDALALIHTLARLEAPPVKGRRSESWVSRSPVLGMLQTDVACHPFEQAHECLPTEERIAVEARSLASTFRLLCDLARLLSLGDALARARGVRPLHGGGPACNRDDCGLGPEATDDLDDAAVGRFVDRLARIRGLVQSDDTGQESARGRCRYLLAMLRINGEYEQFRGVPPARGARGDAIVLRNLEERDRERFLLFRRLAALWRVVDRAARATGIAVRIPRDDLQDFADEFRFTRGLESSQATQAWLHRNNLDAAGFVDLMSDYIRLSILFGNAGILTRGGAEIATDVCWFHDALRLAGFYTRLKRVTPGSRWCPRSCGNSDGAFFRLVKCTTSRPPWQAATGGARHGQGYQQVGRRA